jgi:hypothetical protein
MTGMDADSALLLLDMGDRVELAAREVLAAIDEIEHEQRGRWMPIALAQSVARLRGALGAAAARRLAERAELGDALIELEGRRL